MCVQEATDYWKVIHTLTLFQAHPVALAHTLCTVCVRPLCMQEATEYWRVKKGEQAGIPSEYA